MKAKAFLAVLAIGLFAMVAFINPTTLLSQDASASAGAAAGAKTADTEFGDGVTVELISVSRGDNDLTVKFKYTNSGSKPAEFHHSNYGHENIAALVYYIDPKNKKKYTVIKDAEGKPVASLGENIKLDPGASKSQWVKLPAPPADTTTVTVVLPGAAPFEKVPIAAQ
jgi:hypothetical protein